MENNKTKRVRYILPRDIHTLFSVPEGNAEKLSVTHDERLRNSVTFCNIIDVRTVNGRTRYKIKVSSLSGEITEGWTPGDGLDPVLYDPDEELLDGRFNF